MPLPNYGVAKLDHSKAFRKRAYREGNFLKMFVSNINRFNNYKYTNYYIIRNILEKHLSSGAFYSVKTLNLNPIVFTKKGVMEALSLTVQEWRQRQTEYESNLDYDREIDEEVDWESVNWKTSWEEDDE